MTGWRAFSLSILNSVHSLIQKILVQTFSRSASACLQGKALCGKEASLLKAFLVTFVATYGAAS
jgi:hypothetical protein